MELASAAYLLVIAYAGQPGVDPKPYNDRGTCEAAGAMWDRQHPGQHIHKCVPWGENP